MIVMKRLYVVELRDGSIKVGITSNFKMRMKAFSSMGGGVARHHVVNHKIPGQWQETSLINRVAALASVRVGRERFRGVLFGEAKTLAEQMARRHAIKKTKKARRANQPVAYFCSGQKFPRICEDDFAAQLRETVA